MELTIWKPNIPIQNMKMFSFQMDSVFEWSVFKPLLYQVKNFYVALWMGPLKACQFKHQIRPNDLRAGMQISCLRLVLNFYLENQEQDWTWAILSDYWPWCPLHPQSEIRCPINTFNTCNIGLVISYENKKNSFKFQQVYLTNGNKWSHASLAWLMKIGFF